MKRIRRNEAPLRELLIQAAEDRFKNMSDAHRFIVGCYAGALAVSIIDLYSKNIKVRKEAASYFKDVAFFKHCRGLGLDPDSVLLIAYRYSDRIETFGSYSRDDCSWLLGGVL